MNIENVNKKIEENIKKLVLEKSKSKSQQRLFGLAKSVKQGDTPRSEVSKTVLDIADKMSEKEIEDFSATEHDKLPEKVKKVKEDELQEESEIPILNLDDVDLEENDHNKLNELYESLHKYLVIREFPYEGKDTWTVFASTPDEAKDFVVKDTLHFRGGTKSELTYQVLKSNVKGTKFKGIHKRGSYDEMN